VLFENGEAGRELELETNLLLDFLVAISEPESGNVNGSEDLLLLGTLTGDDGLLL
jgi:hypothetical protein